MKRKGFLVGGLLSIGSLLFGVGGRAQGPLLKDPVGKIAEDARGTVGVYLMDIEDNKGFAFHGHQYFPMQSVFKFPLAVCILDMVDKGKLSPDQKIPIHKKDWVPGTWSPMRDKYKSAEVRLPLREVLAFTVSNSDNIGCDLLFRLAGGTDRVDAYIRNLCGDSIRIVATEAEMATGWEVQYRNRATPYAMGRLLQLFFSGRILSKASTGLLMQLMTETTTGPGRIRELLPAGTVVAHKTGTSNTNKAGMTAATNDVGVITLPNNHHLVIVVFVSDAMADEATRESVIARIAKAAYDQYTSPFMDCPR
ncbi:MAG TPA: class A beta-lactamase, subclass A2 [Puia sp.]|jgi:beta-lactamase class A